MERMSTLKDIAKELGVSTSTVSRILNGKNQQNKRLVKKVQEAAKRLNYQVNTAALGLRTNKTRLIGIIVPYISDDFFSSILAGIESATEPRGYNLLICQSNESHEKEQKLVKSLVACNVEGILISLSKEARDMEFMEILDATGKKAVIFDRGLSSSKYPAILFQDQQAAYEAGQHLIEQGRKKFLYVGLSASLENDQHRMEGYNNALKDAGLPPCEAIYVERLENTQEKISSEDVKKFDAIVCYHDIIAVEVIDHLNSLGVKIPEETAVMGFDNRMIGRFVKPSLSSIDRSTTRMGAIAAETLLSMLDDGETEAPKMDIQAKLIIRDSTSSSF